MNDQLQQDLPFNLPEPLSEIRLTSSRSAKKAFYIVEIIHIIGAGYLIRKQSGAKDAKPNIETWSRPSYSLALEKQQNLINAKLRKTKGRTYEIQIIDQELINDNKKENFDAHTAVM